MCGGWHCAGGGTISLWERAGEGTGPPMVPPLRRGTGVRAGAGMTGDMPADRALGLLQAEELTQALIQVEDEQREVAAGCDFGEGGELAGGEQVAEADEQQTADRARGV